MEKKLFVISCVRMNFKYFPINALSSEFENQSKTKAASKQFIYESLFRETNRSRRSKYKREKPYVKP